MSEADGLRLVETSWAEHAEEISGIRTRVFVDEQGVDPALEIDGEDPDLPHFLVYDGERPVATGRFQPDGRIQRMAVLPAWRGRGAGRLLIEHMIGRAHRTGLDAVYLHSQEHAVGFYARMGFETEGERFFEAGIPHFTMRRRL